jgi:2-polyprenyl-3-methyl-5-hydroxy-6-metoxy-1,4-benzoquinol methylase
MLEWATNKKVNSEFYQEAIRELQFRYLHIVGEENLSEYKEFELPYILERIFKKSRKTILDFGTGTSCLPAYLSVLGYEAWALDDGSWHPEINQRNYNEVYESKVKYVLGNILITPKIVPDNYFDVICSASTLEHVRYPEKYIEALNKKLKVGGIQIHLVDYDVVYHPVDFNKIIKAMGLKDVIGDPPDDLYNPIPNIGRIAICSKKSHE